MSIIITMIMVRMRNKKVEVTIGMMVGMTMMVVMW